MVLRGRKKRGNSRAQRRLRFEHLEKRRVLHGSLAVTPINGEANVSVNSDVQVTFDFDADPSTINASTFQLRHPDGTLVAATVTYDAPSRTATLDPNLDLADIADYYRATVVGGPSGVYELGGEPLEEDQTWHFITESPLYSDTVVLSGLTGATAVEFADDGRIFVAEKSGLIKVFDSLSDSTPDTFADLRTNVHNHWDRGLLGMALHPDFPNTPELFVSYTYDAPLRDTSLPAGSQDFPPAPYWGSPDVSGDPGPGTSGDGPSVSGRLSRLTVGAGNTWDNIEHVLVHDWGQQYPSHTIGDIVFGIDGALYASGGDGASFQFQDFGQNDGLLGSTSLNDPPNQGGALRSQDLRSRDLGDPTPDDPVSLDGTIIRIDPASANGDAFADNPLAGDSDPNAERVIAYGLRNPFRITTKPGTNEIWAGDVGFLKWEEINVIRDPVDSLVENFGWPAFEGVGRQPGYDGLDLPLLENLYDDPIPSAHIEPFLSYEHGEPVFAGGAVPSGNSSSISGLAFSEGGNLPPAFDGALFFADYSRRGVWVMFAGINGEPNPASGQVVLPSANDPVQLKVGPGGDLYYVEHPVSGISNIRRIRFEGVDVPPVAVAQASPTSGPLNLTVDFDATASSDQNPGDTLTYKWDLDGDGALNDSTAAQPTFTYTTAGIVTVTLEVTDGTGLTDTDTIDISAGNTAPTAVIDTPSGSLTWQVGDTINFTGHADDIDAGGNLPDSALEWQINLLHCPGGDCHRHGITTLTGTNSGSIVAPDHEYPAQLEIVLTATDPVTGFEDTDTILLLPQTVDFTFDSVPSGLELTVNGTSDTTPFGFTVIAGSNSLINAPSPQGQGTTYIFDSWSDGGAQSHNVVASATSPPFIATFSTPVAPFDTTNDGLGTITAQGENAPNETRFKAFDNSNGSKWLDFANANPTTRASWIQYQYANGDRYIVSSYTLRSANDNPARDPRDWKLYGSNDGVNFVQLDARTGELFATRFNKRQFLFNNTSAYNIYRLEIESVENPSSANSVQLSEIELLGVPENTPAISYVSVTASDADAAEGNPPLTGEFLFTRSGSTVGNMVVSYDIAGSTADASDYVEALIGTITIPDGAATQTLTITPVDDPDVEGPETVELSVTAGVGYVIAGNNQAEVEIIDNDTPIDPFDTTDVGLAIITAQGQNGTAESKEKAFDNSSGTKWLDFANANPSTRASWIQYEYVDEQYIVTSYTITSANDVAARDPGDWALLGSNDGVGYTVLDTRTNEVFSSRFLKRTFSFANADPYSMYRLRIDSVANPASANSVQLAEIELIGVPGSTNSDPTANDDSGPGFVTDEQSAFTTADVLANDTDPDPGDTLSVTSIDTTGTVGLVTDNGDGTFNYDPNGQFESLAVSESATDTFTYTISDGNGGSDTGTVSITIDGANDAPTAVDDSAVGFVTDEETSFTTTDVLANDTDPDSTDTLSIAALDVTGTLGLVTDNGNGTFNYDPNGQFDFVAVGETATDTFTYTTSDGNGGLSTATVSVTIDGINDAPTAVDDSGAGFVTDEDTAFDTGNVLSNDSDPDAGQFTTVRFAMLGDFGDDSVDAVNVAAMVAARSPDFVVTAGDNRYDAVPYQQAVGDHYGQFLPAASGGTSPTNAFFPAIGNHDYSDGGGISEYLAYFDLPGVGATSTNTSGTERYYDVVEGDVHLFFLDSDEAIRTPADLTAQQTWLQTQMSASTAAWQIVVLHHAPFSSALHGSNTTMQWDYAGWGADAVLAGHDHTYERISQNGISYFVNGLGGRSIYNFAAPIAGSDFQYNADYGAMIIEASLASITFEFLNTSGTAIDAFTINSAPPPPLPNPDTLSITAFDAVGTLGGQVTDNLDGTFGYDPNGLFESLAVGESTTDTFTYTISDGNGGTDTATVSITINGVNDAPTAVDDSGTGFETDEDTSFTTGNVLGNDSDPDTSDTLSISAFDATGTAGGLISDNGDGTFGYDPNGQFESLAVGESDTDTFTYTISDSNGGSDTGTVAISINGVNDAPTATDNANTIAEDATLPVAGNVISDDDGSGVDNDPDASDVLTVIQVNTETDPVNDVVGSYGTFDWDTDGSYSYTLDNSNPDVQALAVGETLNDNFTYTISDGNSGTNTATVSITINGVNDAPTAVDDSGAGFETDEDTSFTTGNVLGNDSDPDTSDTLSISAFDATGTAGGLISDNGDGTFGYDPNGQFESLAVGESDTDTFTYTISDSNGGSDTGTVSITINGVNDNPTAVDDSGAGFTTDEDTAFTTINVLANDFDVDNGDAPSFTGSDLTGVVGQIVDNLDGTFNYDPNGQFEYLAVGESATEIFTYTIIDTNGAADTGNVTITINGLNDAPTATANANTIAEDSVAAASGNLITDDDGNGIDSDPDTNDVLSVSEINGESDPLNDVTGSYGTLQWDSDGSYSYLVDNSNPAVQALTSSQTLPDNFTYTLSDGTDTDTAVLTITITGLDDPNLRSGVVTSVDDSWTTVVLNHTYTSMVVVATANYSNSSVPLVTRIQNAESGNSFDVRVQRADNVVAPLSGPVSVHYVVVEEGTYNVNDHGVKMEAVKFTSTVTDGSGSWTGESRPYNNGSYTSPVVIGQVMTDTPGSGFSTFWAHGGTNRRTPPQPTSLTVGKHRGEDPTATRPDETIGYIVFQAGSGSIDSLAYVAAVGDDSVRGLGQSPPYNYSISGPASPLAAIVSQTAMDGNDGGWAVLYGTDPVSQSNLSLAIDEDQASGTERNHTTEQVAYVIFGTSNQAPINSLPGPQNTTEDSALTFSVANGNLVSVSDADAGANPLEVTLSATDGLLSLGDPTALVFSQGDGTDDSSMTFTGTISQINIALDGMTFSPTADFNGAASLSIHTNDQGFSGPGGPRSDTDVVDINVDAVNDAPVNNVPAPQVVAEDNTLVFSNGNGNEISVGDVDANTGPVLITLDATNGTLSLAATTGLNFTVGDGIDDDQMIFTGMLVDINAALANMAFAPDADYNGPATLELTSNDLGSTGGGQLLDTDLVDIAITAMNDAPVLSVPGSQNTDKNSPVEFATDNNPIEVNDVDAGSAAIEVTLDATDGTVTLSTTNGLVFSTGDGSGDALMVFTGSLNDVNTALDGMEFLPDLDFVGPANLQVTVDDLGNTGGGNLVDTQNIPVIVSDPMAAMSGGGAGEQLRISSPTGSNTAPTSTSFGDFEARSGLSVFDVNGDNLVTALDVLLVINYLTNQRGAASNPGQVAEIAAGELFTEDKHDVNKDGIVSALDAVLIINTLF